MRDEQCAIFWLDNGCQNVLDAETPLIVRFRVFQYYLRFYRLFISDGHLRHAHLCVNPPLQMQSLDPTYPLYSVLSFLGFIVVLIPFSWHLQAWNAGTCAYMFWVSFACLVEFINSLVWAGNLFNNIPVWCDICSYFPPLYIIVRVLTFHILLATKFLLGAGVGIVASALCISRRLYSIASVQSVAASHIDVSA